MGSLSFGGKEKSVCQYNADNLPSPPTLSESLDWILWKESSPRGSGFGVDLWQQRFGFSLQHEVGARPRSEYKRVLTCIFWRRFVFSAAHLSVRGRLGSAEEHWSQPVAPRLKKKWGRDGGYVRVSPNLLQELCSEFRRQVEMVKKKG